MERFGKKQSELQSWFLKEWRTHRGLTQEQLANLVQSTHVTVSRMERGIAPYNQPFLEACAEALNCHAYQLLMGPPSLDDRGEISAKLATLSDEQLKKISSIIDIMQD